MSTLIERLRSTGSTFIDKIRQGVEKSPAVQMMAGMNPFQSAAKDVQNYERGLQASQTGERVLGVDPNNYRETGMHLGLRENTISAAMGAVNELGYGAKAIKSAAKPVINKADDILSEARKYKSAEEFVKAQEAPKTVTVWNKSKFSSAGAYTERPVIRKVENKTLYQGGDDTRQFWTPDKKYAEQFGNVKEKTGTFYQVDNGNRMTEVYVDASKVKSQLTDLWNKANKQKGSISPKTALLAAGVGAAASISAPLAGEMMNNLNQNSDYQLIKQAMEEGDGLYVLDQIEKINDPEKRRELWSFYDKNYEKGYLKVKPKESPVPGQIRQDNNQQPNNGAVHTTYPTASKASGQISGVVLPPKENATSTQFTAFTNSYRKEKGLNELSYEPTLTNIAQLRAEEIAANPDLWKNSKPGDHKTANGKLLWDIYKENGYDYLVAGENLAKEYPSLEKAFEALKKSPTHHANLINPKFQDLGIGWAKLPNGKWVVVQTFGKKK